MVRFFQAGMIYAMFQYVFNPALHVFLSVLSLLVSLLSFVSQQSPAMYHTSSWSCNPHLESPLSCFLLSLHSLLQGSRT
jgi:hypothetical protein